MNYKYPLETIEFGDHEIFNGLSLLEVFKEEVTKEKLEHDQKILWGELIKYLTEEEELNLFIEWEKARFGHGINSFLEIYYNIRDRMQNAL